MNHFNLKSLAFYGTAIGSVLLIFKAVTVYGENRLKASPAIAGTYRLIPSAGSACLGPEARLTLEQSGIYLLGTLSTNGNQVSLDGRFQGDRFRVSGSAGDLPSCPDPVVIEAIVRDKTITGTIGHWALTFEKEAATEESPSRDH